MMNIKIGFLISIATVSSISLKAQEETTGQTANVITTENTVSTPSEANPDSTLRPVLPQTAVNERPVAKWHLPAIDSIALNYHLLIKEMEHKYQRYHYTKADTLANPYYFYVFSQPTYYTLPVHYLIGELSPSAYSSITTPTPSLLPTGSITPKPLISGITQALGDIYTNHPQFIKRSEDAQLAAGGIRNDVNHDVKPKVNFTESVSDQEKQDEYKADDWDIVVHRPNFWKFKANTSLQVMQYYVSDNWYKGGESNYSWLATSTLEANYNNKQKVTFDNRLEMRLGFQSSKGDTEHKFRANNDLLRLTNKLGLKATKHWYYTLMLKSWTQFYPGYKKNDKKVYSDFMSPFESVFSLGMDYKLSLKRFTLNATISPLAGNYKYVSRKSLAGGFGLEKDKQSKFDFGSDITVNYNWNIAKNISWQGRIFFFTDYESTRVEWENTFNLKVNNFLSTKIYLFPRFDDGVKRKDDQSYYQFKETLSLSFNFDF